MLHFVLHGSAGGLPSDSSPRRRAPASCLPRPAAPALWRCGPHQTVWSALFVFPGKGGCLGGEAGLTPLCLQHLVEFLVRSPRKLQPSLQCCVLILIKVEELVYLEFSSRWRALLLTSSGHLSGGREADRRPLRTEAKEVLSEMQCSSSPRTSPGSVTRWSSGSFSRGDGKMLLDLLCVEVVIYFHSFLRNLPASVLQYN